MMFQVARRKRMAKGKIVAASGKSKPQASFRPLNAQSEIEGQTNEEAPETGGLGASSGSYWGEPVMGREAHHRSGISLIAGN